MSRQRESTSVPGHSKLPMFRGMPTIAIPDPFTEHEVPLMANSFNSKASLTVDNVNYTIYRLDAVYKKYPAGPAVAVLA